MSPGWFGSRNRDPDYWALVAPWWESIDVQASPQAFARQFERMPEPAGVLFAAHWLFSEVRSGGFAQFFWNATGVLAPEAHEAFIEIGLEETAGVIAAAMRILGDPYLRVCEARQRILAGVWDRTPDSRFLRESLEDQTRAFRRTLGRWRMGKFAKFANAFARRNRQA